MARPTAILLNDTTDWYHWGCTATSLGLKSLIGERYDLIDAVPIRVTYGLARPPNSPTQFQDAAFFRAHAADNADLYRRIERADCVFVHGEGTIHGLSRAAVNLLYMAFAARRHLGKPVYVVNHSLYPHTGRGADAASADAFYRSIYAVFDYIAIRETLSKEIADRLGMPAVLSFDCLPLTAGQLFSTRPARGETLAIAGSVAFEAVGLGPLVAFANGMKQRGHQPVVITGAQAKPAADDARFVAALRALGTGDWRYVEAGSLTEWLSTIGSAALLVSGRFHHSLAAFAMRTPFVMLNSNTPKMNALAAMLGAPEPIRYDDPQLDRLLVERAEQARSEDFARSVFDPARNGSLLDLARKNLPPA
ncbi:MAG TPA: polysaccharide pyruvyl transferase family protein [Candidatus Acidoferrum sp.]|nr:polysaccharide pyruvyl transferase family protein [Candidatus Acidoferrum sp.]